MTTHIRIYSDYICPFCYIGKGILDRLAQEFDIAAEWLPFEIHPETPPGGALLTEHLPHIDWDDLYRNLRSAGKEYGIVFGRVRMLPNSRMALEASEYARDHGAHGALHEALFRAYFTDLQDIGNRAVLLDIARSVGLDPGGLEAALDAGTYRDRLDQTQRAARRRDITAVPAFIINDCCSIVGAQPLPLFRETLGRIAQPRTAHRPAERDSR